MAPQLRLPDGTLFDTSVKGATFFVEYDALGSASGSVVWYSKEHGFHTSRFSSLMIDEETRIVSPVYEGVVYRSDMLPRKPFKGLFR